MTLKISDGLRNKLMTNGEDGGKSMADILANGFIDVYKGVRPADCEAVETDAENFLFRLLKSGETPITSGSLVADKLYKINTFVAGDDFTNVGGTNETGNVFTATGTTPTTWANGSELQEVGLIFGNAVEGKISKPTDAVWSCVITNSGLASWFRYYASITDIGVAVEANKVRFEGRVAVYGGQLQIANTNVEAGKVQGVDNFHITLPV